MDEELDISWADKLSKELHSETYLEPELLDSITVFSLFINEQNEITHYDKEDYDLEIQEHKSVLSESKIMQIIQAKKGLDSKDKRYAFDGMSTFFIDCNGKQLPEFISDNAPFVKTASYKIPQNLDFNASLFLFEDDQCVFLLFREMELVVPKPILRNNTKIKRHKTKKRVRIASQLPTRYGDAANKTRRVQQ
jgi:hypothetical protein